ncbi:DUF1552 domain-containing protein [Lignipirellula cremea]|uniref:DUF1552 domain-containing protein n=1 Tax=Lignipirellula cremea TaxID=2528010 RepID=A0A518DL89_9BACT|nr:DUF1552 domain-containing protein [Lignipirellula cremea]QDU92596.1 hypothetical protein Pla8534_03440 [Lignipirellula cremea]
MANQSWRLGRRTFLMGAGASLGLPWLECMAAGSQQAAVEPPRRLCAMYFGFGVSLPKEDGEQARWRWFPNGEGRDYQFNESLKPLEPHRDQLTVLGGMSHPNGRRMGGHDTGDTFLTGALLTSRFLRNTVSVDQIAAQQFAEETRFPSLVMSTDGGVGEPTRSSTLSYNDKGRPVPALNQPQQIFDRFFGAGDANSLAQKRRLTSASGMLDRVLENSRSLRAKLGRQDREKLDEYLASVRQIEERVAQSQRWLEIPRPELRDEERKMLHLDSDDQAPQNFIRTMYDLIYLAFRTDSTRVATYQITNMADASSRAGKFPQLEGFKGSLHNLAHGWNKPEGAEALGRWDRFMAGQFAHFLERLSTAEEAGGSILDHSVVLYGSSNSTTHNNQNYPLVLAGGRKLGLQHGRYLKYGDDAPLSNLFVTMLNCIGVQQPSFADSTGPLSELYSA